MLSSYLTELFECINDEENTISPRIFIYHVYKTPYLVNLIEYILAIFLVPKLGFVEHNIIRKECGKPPIILVNSNAN
jgi:hypothetical protein